MNTEYWLVLITFGKKTKILRRNKADYMRSWKDNVDRKLIEWTEFSFQDIFKSNRSIYSFTSESFWRSILWMLRLNFTLGIWRISLDRLFQTLTPFLEKDMFSLSNLEYSRKKLPFVDDLVLCEWILCWKLNKLLIWGGDVLFETSYIKTATDLK